MSQQMKYPRFQLPNTLLIIRRNSKKPLQTASASVQQNTQSISTSAAQTASQTFNLGVNQQPGGNQFN
jgi:hypothetical protein